MFNITENHRINMLKRVPILFATLASLIPIFGLIDFSVNWIHSTALTVVYSSIFFVEVCLLVLGIEISDSELNVYGVMLISSFIITTVYMHHRYSTGNDTKFDFILNMLGFVVAIVSMIFQIAIDRTRNLNHTRSLNLAQQLDPARNLNSTRILNRRTNSCYV